MFPRPGLEIYSKIRKSPVFHKHCAISVPGVVKTNTVEIDELNDPIGPRTSYGRQRCSDKGFLGMPAAAYMELLDWTARQIVNGKRGATPEDAPPIVEAEFTYIPAEYAPVISQNRDGDSSFYHFDGINNVRQLTGDSEVVTDEYDFNGWGERRSSTGSTANSQQYKGRLLAYRRDPNVGPDEQYAMHHRNYDPKTATFTSDEKELEAEGTAGMDDRWNDGCGAWMACINGFEAADF